MILENKIRGFILTVILLLIIISFSLPVFAHKVILYAYAEGDKIIAEGAFGDGSPAKNAEIFVYNKEGELLAEGKTDENGLSEIPIPKRTDLKLKMNAGMGHQAEYSLAKSELPEISSDNQNSKIASNQKTEAETETKTAYNSLSEEKLRKIIAEEMDRKLTPLKKTLIELKQDQGPGVTEIIGGIGYIFGLMGIILYFKQKKNA